LGQESTSLKRNERPLFLLIRAERLTNYFAL